MLISLSKDLKEMRKPARAGQAFQVEETTAGPAGWMCIVCSQEQASRIGGEGEVVSAGPESKWGQTAQCLGNDKC